MGKAEGRKELWHGHVTAVTVAPEYRRLGVAKQLMDSLETVRLGIFAGGCCYFPHACEEGNESNKSRAPSGVTLHHGNVF